MVFRFKCFEFLYSATEIENRGNMQTKSSSSQRGWKSSQTKSSSAESYYSAPAEFSLVDQDGFKVFTYHELKQATGNFSSSSKIGDEEFGSIYKAVIQYRNEDLQVMVKHLNKRRIQELKEWAMAFNDLGLVNDANIVKLVGYCAEYHNSASHQFLVYEYFPKGSVRDHLSAKSGAPLPWDVRLNVARDVAHCLACLRGPKGFEFILGNFKSSDVLLDDQWNAKLLCPSEGLYNVSRTAVENIGFEAPEYYLNRNDASKSVVWSFGVVLCELITGRCPFDQSRPKDEQKLVEWVKPCLNSRKCIQILDSRLVGHCSLSSVKKLSKVAKSCLANNPKARPTMFKVMGMVDRVVMETTLEGKGRRRFLDGKCVDFRCLTRLCQSGGC